MASGFIILGDGRCLSVRHTAHDALLRSIAAAMPEAYALRPWLLTQVPKDEDPDLGHAFVRSSGEQVERFLDLRGLTDGDRLRFVEAVRTCQAMSGETAPLEDVVAALERFRSMLDCWQRGDPPLELSDWVEVAPPCDCRIGPGWDGPA